MDTEELKRTLKKANIKLSDMLKMFSVQPQQRVKLSEEDYQHVLHLIQTKDIRRLPMDAESENRSSLSKNKQKAIDWIRKFQCDLQLPSCIYSAINNSEKIARYKIPICVLLSYLELNVEKDETDLNETKVMIDCIKRTLPSLELKSCQRLAQYLDNVMNALTSVNDKGA